MTEMRSGLIDEGIDVVGNHDVATDKDRPIPDVESVEHAVALLLATTVERYRCSLGQERLRDAEADACCATRDRSYATVQLPHRDLLSSANRQKL
jgi:hypothetical protein